MQAPMRNYGAAIPSAPGENVHGSWARPFVYGQGLASESAKTRPLKMPRRRMNLASICLSVMIPWSLFASMSWGLGFTFRYVYPTTCSVFVVFAALCTLVCLFLALEARRRQGREAEHNPSWLMFVFLSMTVAFVLALILGNVIFYSYTVPHRKILEMNLYTDVRVDQFNGLQSMDAGRIVFATGTHIQVEKSMGFKNIDVYCVAPIVFGNTTLARYDYWAVGKGCCSGLQADFHCANFDNQQAASGLRLLSDADRAFYRLAVQQAEAVHNITAVHPLFFEWVPDVVSSVEELDESAIRMFRVSVAGHLIAQSFMAASTALAFSKLPHF
eukprot:TRINITY_DN7091_c0_g1_i3.p1 TRINITY_DN7091_c0_g1~~TRINITY_DN7091_c0_g1_i3.p1  ORF type:complete len:329 (+),score=41.85 TRINITY_DN7091_c0_g1_i3:110-1096(+)